jgi:hypothetical protein
MMATASEEDILEAVSSRAADTPPADAIVQVLIAGIDPANVHEGPPILGPDFEDRLTAVLAHPTGGKATPAMRAHAMQLAGLIRLQSSEEVRRAVAAKMPGRPAANEVKAILWSAAEAVKRAYP